MKKQSVFILVAAILILGIGFFLASSSDDGQNAQNQDIAGQNDDVVAVVNGEEITRVDLDVITSQVALQQGIDIAEIDEQTQNQIESQSIEAIVNQTLLGQVAENSEVDVPESEIDNQINMIKEQFQSEEAFQEALAMENVTEEELREQVREGLLIETYLEQELSLSETAATEEEVTQAYEQITSANQEIGTLDEIFEQIENIVIQQKNSEAINQLIQELRDGAEIQVLI
ncbi:hypothetical protein GW764_03815 [Candidatus Parcubacteria bacterium]|nr:hypothetical protein [Candidatus Parcubacteria bacterium]